LQAEVLTLVLLNPQQEWSLTGLASRTAASVSSVHPLVGDSGSGGHLRRRRINSSGNPWF